MDRVDKYKRIEDDQQQGKGKAKVVPQERRDFRSDRYNNNWPRRDHVEQPGQITIKWSGCIPRASASSIGKSQERILLQMTQQNGGKS